MAYDEELANRLREQLAEQEGITEKRMFGGLAFLINGNLCVAASGQGGLLVRIDPEDSEEVLERPHTAMMEMRGRSMPGWIRVGPEGLRSTRDLCSWVSRAVRYAGSLPAKG
jgi:TfoX/Sxy family transcriptional regulator of competence genes